MKKYIVVTSINQPSAAILRFRQWHGWHLMVVGDRKSPAAWECPGSTYLNLKAQYARFGASAKAQNPATAFPAAIAAMVSDEALTDDNRRAYELFPSHLG